MQVKRNWTYRPSADFESSAAGSLGYDNTLSPFFLLFCGLPAALIMIVGENLAKTFKENPTKHIDVPTLTYMY